MAKSLLAISCDGLLTACDLKVTVEKPVHKSRLAAAMSRQLSGKVHSLRPSCQAERQNPTSCSGDLHTVISNQRACTTACGKFECFQFCWLVFKSNLIFLLKWDNEAALVAAPCLDDHQCVRYRAGLLAEGAHAFHQAAWAALSHSFCQLP